MGTTCYWQSMDDSWLAGRANPSWQDISSLAESPFDDDELSLETDTVSWAFDGRTDDLRHLFDGELVSDGGLREWRRKDCCMGFITAATVTRIAALLPEVGRERLLGDAAAWTPAAIMPVLTRLIDGLYDDMCAFLASAGTRDRGMVVVYFG